MAAEAQMKSAGTELEKRILRLHKGGTGILKIGKELGIGTGTVQRVLMERPRPTILRRVWLPVIGQDPPEKAKMLRKVRS